MGDIQNINKNSVANGEAQKESEDIKDTGKDVVAETRVRMDRHMGLLHACGVIVSQVVGTGIFLTPRGVTSNVGSVGASLIVWTFCGLTNIMGSLMYAEMGAVMPHAGGEYVFVKNCFGPVAAFSAIWAMAIVVRPCSFIIMGRTAGNYLLQLFFPHCIVPHHIVTLFCLTCMIIIMSMNCLSIRLSVKIQTLYSAGKVLALVVIIITGIVQLARGSTGNFHPSRAFEGTKLDVGNLALAVYSGYYAFMGWDILCILQEEVKNPGRILPLAAFLSMSMVIVVYVMANVSYFTVMSTQELVASPAVALTFAQRTLGGAAWIISVFVALSAIGSINVGTLGVSRLMFSGGRDGCFPAILSMLHHTRMTPIPAIALSGVLGLVYLAVPDVSTLITYTSVVSQIRVNIAFTCFFYLRWKRPEWERPVKFNIVLAAFAYIISVALFFLGFIRAPVTSAVGTVVYLTSIPVYFFNFKVAQRRSWIIKAVGKITAAFQQFFLVVPEEKAE